MLIVALLLALADPAQAPEFFGGEPTYWTDTTTILDSSADTLKIYDTRHIDFLAVDGTDEVAEYDVKTSTWTFQPGYDFDDVGRIILGLRARKDSELGETCWQWPNGTRVCELTGHSKPTVAAGPPTSIESVFLAHDGSTSSVCSWSDSGQLLCSGTSENIGGSAQTTFWGWNQSVVSGDAGSLYSDDDTGIMLFKDSAWLVLNGTLLFPLPVFVPLTAKAAYTTSWLVWFFGVCFFFRLRATRMTEPVQMQPAPDGLLDELMSKIFGRSWRTGIAGLAGAALTVVAALTAVDAPYTFKKIAPLLPNVVMSLGLMTAKDGKVSHTQIPKT